MVAPVFTDEEHEALRRHAIGQETPARVGP
ncbi:hypothetical protein N599_29495 [Saccharopolyspora erythraea D]|nr:hypothetical protein N599_29495 [Saccharopolyspora erythraea D]